MHLFPKTTIISRLVASLPVDVRREDMLHSHDKLQLQRWQHMRFVKSDTVLYEGRSRSNRTFAITIVHV